MTDHKKSSKPTNVGTQVDDMPECAKYENPYHRFASAEGDIQHCNNMPDGMTTDQLLASIEEIEKQVVGPGTNRQLGVHCFKVWAC